MGDSGASVGSASTSILFAVAVLAGTVTACQAQPPAFSADDLAALTERIEAYVKAERAGDWDTWSEMLTDDVVQLPPNQPAIEGRAAVKAWAEAFPTITEVTLTPLEIDGRQDLAFVRGRYSITIVVPGVGDEAADSGKYVNVWRKQADDLWLLAIGIWNSDLVESH